MRATQQMTKGSPWKLILAFSFPLMLGNLCQQFYIMVDAAIVGQILGVSAIAAVGATEWIIWMMQGLVQGFTQGFSIKMAQDYGAEDYSSLRKDVVHSLVLSIVSTLILVILCFVSMKAMLSMLNTPTDVLGDASIYLKTMIFALPIVMVYNLTAAILRSLGDSKTPLIAMIVASIINIILDILFVYNFKMGVFGAAFATMIAQCFSAVICLIKCMSISYLRFYEEDRKFDKVLSLYLMKLGMPMAFQNAVISIGGMILQSVINGFGVIFLAGFTAANKLYGLLEVAATSYGYAMVTYVGQNVGAHQFKRVKKGYWGALFIALITSVVIGVAMIVFGKQILLLFINGESQIVSQTLEIAYRYLSIMAVCLPILYYLHVTRSTIQGLGNTVLPMVSGIVEFVMRTFSAFMLPMIIGSSGIFYAEITAWLGADFVLFASYIYCMKKAENSMRSL